MTEPTRLFRVTLGPERRPTGATRHSDGMRELPTPSSLEIVRYPDAHEVYLLYLDAEGRWQTDTWHETVESAMEQARFEFGVAPGEWARVSSA